MTKEQLKAREELKRITGIWIIDNNEGLVLDDFKCNLENANLSHADLTDNRFEKTNNKTSKL